MTCQAACGAGVWLKRRVFAVRPVLVRIVVSIDPAATSGEGADETGIIVAGKDGQGHGWVLADLSGRYPPVEWAKAAVAAYRAHKADRIVAEVNNGGEMVEATLRVIDPNSGLRSGVRVARQNHPRRAGRRPL